MTIFEKDIKAVAKNLGNTFAVELWKAGFIPKPRIAEVEQKFGNCIAETLTTQTKATLERAAQEVEHMISLGRREIDDVPRRIRLLKIKE